MRTRQHPNDEKLIALLDPSDAQPHSERVSLEAHVNECPRCTARLSRLREVVTFLGKPDVWDRRSRITTDDTRAQQIGMLAERLRHEERDAETLLATVLSGPAAWWRARSLRQNSRWTQGLVQKLLDRAETLIHTAPADALEVTAIAVEIADALRVDAYPFDLVISARAHAWREHAYSLLYIGRLTESLHAIDRAEHLFGQLPVPDFDLARTSIIRAAIYRATDRVPEAIPLAQRAAEVFQLFGNRTRYTKARMTEAALLYRQGRFAEALAVWQPLEDEPALESDPAYASLLHNIGNAYRDLGEFDQARTYLQRAIGRYDVLGLEVEKVRTRWVFAEMLVMSGRVSEGLPLLRTAWREFEHLGMEIDAALVGLEVAEALLLSGQNDDVPAICRDILDRFTREGMTSRAVTALSFLREAVALGKASPALVRHVHDFLRDLPTHPARTFLPPPPL